MRFLRTARTCSLFVALTLLLPNYSNAGFIKDGVTVIYGRGDTVFKVCNRSDKRLFLAFVYRHVWKFGEEPTWPAKGWYQLDRGSCNDVAVNGLMGVMSVMYEDGSGNRQPYYSGGSTRLADSRIGNGQSELIKTEYLCIGDSPFDGYKDKYPDYYTCEESAEKIPFQVVFDAYGNSDFTLTLN